MSAGRLRFGTRVSPVRPGVLAVSFSGDLDLDAFPVAERILREAMETAREVVVDLAGLDFMDSSGARLLAEAHERAAASGGTLAVHAGEGMPSRVLRLVGLASRLTLVGKPDLQAANGHDGLAL